MWSTSDGPVPRGSCRNMSEVLFQSPSWTSNTPPLGTGSTDFATTCNLNTRPHFLM
jgi:hypothetical protein